METQKTEEYYYIRVSILPSDKGSSQASQNSDSAANIKFKHPSYITIQRMERKNKGHHPSYDAFGVPSSFYQVLINKRLSYTQFMNHLTMSWSMPQSSPLKTENTFKIRLSDIIKTGSNKEKFTEKHILTSVNPTCKMELIVIPSYNQLTTEILDKIISHEDSKLTVDSFSRFENLSTQQSLRYLQRKNMFKRKGKQLQVRLQKKSKSPNINRQGVFIKGSKRNQISPVRVKQDQSPFKRAFRMRRSQLIPQDYKCEMEQINQHQILNLQYYQKNASKIAYIFALVIQILLIIKLMSPSSKL